VLYKTNPDMVDTMKNFSQAEADAFARQWAAAWNSHDVDLIVGHYRHDIQYYSPFTARLDASTPLSGRGELRRYVAAALERYPSVRLGPDLAVAPGAGSITIGYRSVDNLLATETLAIDDHGLITHARCHYRKRHLVGWFTSPP
jgi:SnoaL-like domain